MTQLAPGLRTMMIGNAPWPRLKKRSGWTRTSPRRSAISASFGPTVDTDGWKDLFVVAGHVYPFVGKYGLGEEFHQPRQLYWNRGDGQFFDMSSNAGPGITAKHSSRGIAVGDLDNDGSQEIVVINLFEPPSLLKNFGPQGNALLVRALTASGRDAIGARITVTSGRRNQIDEVRSGGYHISQGDCRVHFGLGTATRADVAVRWLQGAVETFKDVAANQLIVARQGRGIVETRPLRRAPNTSR
jgi:hypothetical protein